MWCCFSTIHAPTRGATRIVRLEGNSSVFQSTLLNEERLWGSSARLASWSFQSTLLREERRAAEFLGRVHGTFNPRSCVRSDLRGSGVQCWRGSFNPRSCVRSDLNQIPQSRVFLNFQSTLLREERHYRLLRSAKVASFNPRSCARSDI